MNQVILDPTDWIKRIVCAVASPLIIAFAAILVGMGFALAAVFAPVYFLTSKNPWKALEKPTESYGWDG